MSKVEKWSHLCELLAAVAPNVDAIGAFSETGEVLSLKENSRAASETPGRPSLPMLRSLAERLGGPSPLHGNRAPGLPRAMVTAGRRKLLLRSLSGNNGFIFVVGGTDCFPTDAWLLLDAVAVLGGALENRSRSTGAEEKR